MNDMYIMKLAIKESQKSLKKHLKSPCKCVIIFRGHFTSRCFCDTLTVVLQLCKRSKINFDFVIVGFLLFFIAMI